MIVFSTTIYSFEVGLCTVQIILCHTNKYNYLQGKLCTLGCAATKQNHRFKFNNYLNCNKIYACTPAAWKTKVTSSYRISRDCLIKLYIYIYTHRQLFVHCGFVGSVLSCACTQWDRKKTTSKTEGQKKHPQH